MTENDVINMLKDALDGVDASNVPSSDFDNAVMTAVCVNVLIKNNFFSAETILPALELEIKDFIKVLNNAKGKNPSVNYNVIDFCTSFLSTQAGEIKGKII